jgi:hypothetical protein
MVGSNPNPSLSSSLEIKVPSKLFLLGEYAVLYHSPALLMTFEPCFKFEISNSEGHSPHPDSPAGRLKVYAEKLGKVWPVLSFQDPYQGAGGFGFSSAEYLAYFKLLFPERELRLAVEAWRLFRELMSDGKSKAVPSGADVVAQAAVRTPGQHNSFVVWEPRAQDVKLLPFKSSLKMLVLSATFGAQDSAKRKVATHNDLFHLKDLAMADVTKLEEISQRGTQALATGEFHFLANCLNQYAEKICSLGLEHPQATLDRVAISGLPGVFCVKGCGAQLADAIVVMVDATKYPDVVEKVIDLAHERGLYLLHEFF